MTPSCVVIDPYYIRVRMGDIHVIFIRELIITDKTTKLVRRVYCEDVDQSKVELPELDCPWRKVSIVGYELIIETDKCEASIDLDLQIEAAIVQEGNETYLMWPE